ncbi:hypothetical protein FQN54_008059 [Arachnomyces sp. PD_36]|nr:hypothetical protein FQN54_008059 [Arachnomyces sp. PD_36]
MTIATQESRSHIARPSSPPILMPAQVIPRPAPPINTPRLFMRPLENGDAADVYAIRGQYDVMKWRYISHSPYVAISFIKLEYHSKSKTPDASVEVTENWIRKNFTDPKLKPPYNFSILEKGPESSVLPRVIGVIGVLFMGSNPVVGYIIHPDSWGKGYATEALGALLDAWWALPVGETEAEAADGPKADPDVLFAETEKNNTGSLRVLEKCGFHIVDEFDDEGVPVVVLKLARPS